MSAPGQFIINHFKNKEIEMWTSNENENIHYADSDSFSWCIIVGKVIDYDVVTGILVLESLATKRKFFINEFKIEMFWEPGFDIRECTTASLRSLKKNNSKDIM